jgi:purine-nucleoside phosphorylase
MEAYRKSVEDAAAFIRSRLEFTPEIGLILGTGLGGIAGSIGECTEFPYAEIPHFPVSTAPGHKGRLVCGKWAGKKVLVMQGRFHLYEGYTPREVGFPIRVMSELGVRTLIVSNAAGGLDPQYRSGDLMLVTDHINLTGYDPLTGQNVDDWGPRFPDMGEPYRLRLQDLAVETAASSGISLRRGVYVGLKGPSLETQAEVRYLRIIGADAVGMSLVMETITAVHAGMDVLAFSVITNENASDRPEPVSLEKIVACAEASGDRLTALIEQILLRL